MKKVILALGYITAFVLVYSFARGFITGFMQGWNSSASSTQAHVDQPVAQQQQINYSTPTPEQNSVSNNANNAQSVVHIGCDNGYGGSGIILTKNGLIVTNNHVITGSNSCIVTIPNPVTGTITSIYTAQPLIAPNLSQIYDIAVLSITGSYTDSNRKIWGVYPTTFTAYVNPSSCWNATPQLGDPIRIYGYPVTSGGYNLTVTDGIISSFTDNGNILTSAQVDSGNSGGLAINPKTGCIDGIPSAVSQGNYQNLGVIIPTSVLLDYLQKAEAQAANPIPTDTPTPYIPPQTYQQTNTGSDNPPAGGYQNYGWYMHNGQSMQYVNGNWYSTPQQNLTPTPTINWWSY